MRNQSSNASIVETLEGRALLSTYYVTTGGVNGNSGSSANPWRTLQYAADRVVAGDTVIVAPGNYVGFDLRTSGTANARITFKAAERRGHQRVNTAHQPRRHQHRELLLRHHRRLHAHRHEQPCHQPRRHSRGGRRLSDTGAVSAGRDRAEQRCRPLGRTGASSPASPTTSSSRTTSARDPPQQHGIYFSN